MTDITTLMTSVISKLKICTLYRLLFQVTQFGNFCGILLDMSLSYTIAFLLLYIIKDKS